MSQVNQLFCTVCNPEAGDINGIRKTVHVTSQELSFFVKHFIENHITVSTDESPVIDQEARDAAAEAQTVAGDALRLAQSLDPRTPASAPVENTDQQ